MKTYFFSILALALASGCAYQDERYARPPVSVTGDEVISSPKPAVSVEAPVPAPPPSADRPLLGSGTAPAARESDEALARRVRTELDQYGVLADLSDALIIRASRGAVTLSGVVPTERDKEMINALVKNTPGVVVVNNQLQVSSAAVVPAPSGRERQGSRVYENEPVAPTAVLSTANMFNLHVQGLNDADRALAQRVITGLREDAALVALLPKVDINVADGKVTLRGTVHDAEQRRIIEESVERATGTRVINDLQVLGSRTP